MRSIQAKWNSHREPPKGRGPKQPIPTAKQTYTVDKTDRAYDELHDEWVLTMMDPPEPTT